MDKETLGNLVWMDLEMSGLDVEKEVVIEIATIITDSQLTILEEGPCLAIHHEDAILNAMDEWNTTHHGDSGLIQRVKESKLSTADAERQTLDFIKQYCPPQKTPLCGNSIGQDRKFLEKYMPELGGYLHYRNIDVSTIKELVQRWYPDGPKPPKKSEAHLALSDIRESLKELIFYRKHYFAAEKPSVS